MSSDLYRSFGGSMRFYTQGGAGGQQMMENVRAILFKSLSNNPSSPMHHVKVWMLIGGVVGLLVLILLIRKMFRKSSFEGFAPGNQTASGFGGTFTVHRSQHSPRNRTVDNLAMIQDMKYQTGQIASGQPNAAARAVAPAMAGHSGADHFGDLQKVLARDNFAQVKVVPSGQNIVPIPAAGQANPGQFKAGFADFAEHFDGQDYTTNQEWLERRLNLKKKSGFANVPNINHNENNLGFIHVLPEQDYKEGGSSAGLTGSMAQVPYLNNRTMGFSERPNSQRLVEGFGPQTGFDALAAAAKGAKKSKFGNVSLQRTKDMRGDLPLTEFQAKVLAKSGMASGTATSPATMYTGAHIPSSFASRNMLSGNPNAAAREVVTNYCSPKKSPQCKSDPLCSWDANSQGCVPAKRPSNECAFPVNPKYNPIDPSTGLKAILPADACIDASHSDFNKWVETNWVLNYEQPYSSMKQSDVYYKDLQNLIYNNPKAWDVSKPKDTPTSIKPGEVAEYDAARRAPVGVDDTKLVTKQKEGFLDVMDTVNSVTSTVKGWFGSN